MKLTQGTEVMRDILYGLKEIFLALFSSPEPLPIPVDDSGYAAIRAETVRRSIEYSEGVK
jgi:hypothetical protein